MDMTYNLNGSFKPTMKRFADLDGPDFFPTPAWATHALIDNEKFIGDIWESACGNGAMSNVLEHTGQRVISTDLYDRGFWRNWRELFGSAQTGRKYRYEPALQCSRRICPKRIEPIRQEIRSPSEARLSRRVQ